jgi:cobalt-zinc-cadmium resistance protein CzcA
VFNRIPDLSLPSGVTPSVSPLFSPSGLIYRYVLQSPDRSPMELKTFEDWVVEPQYKSVPGVADDSGFGGGTMQYQVLLDPAKIAGVGLSVAQVESALAPTTATPAAGSIRRAASSITCAAGPLEPRWRTSATWCWRCTTARRAGQGCRPVVIGIAPRLGEFGFEKQDDAVEGVILMRTGEKPRTC